jgi:hypothetical protein
MSPTINGTFGPLPLEKVQNAPCIALKSIQDWRVMVVKAFGKAGLQQKAAAAEMEITAQQLSNQMSGKEHLSFWRMFSLPREFWVEMVDLICEFHDIPARGATAQDIEYMRIGKAYCELQQQVARSAQR